jgi:hypothetical protein
MTFVHSVSHNHTARQVTAIATTIAAAGAPNASSRFFAIAFCGTNRSGAPNAATGTSSGLG